MADDVKLGYTIALGLNYGVVALEAGDIQQFYFIEDIFSFCMVGKMIFEDRYGIVENGPFTGNERILLAYGETKSRRLLFDIIKIEKMTMSSPTKSSSGTQLVIYFVDTTYKYFTKKRFSTSWKKTNNKKILEDILYKMCQGSSNNEKIILKRYDPTDNKSDFVIPYWTPIESMLWLNKKTYPKASQNKGNNKIGGYLYYNNTYWDDGETKNKDNNFTAAWKSINYLFGFPTTNKNEWIDHENPFLFSGSPGEKESPTYVNKILDWKYSGIDFSSIKKIQGGHMLGYNFDGKDLIDRKYKYSKKNDTEKVHYGMIEEIAGLGNKSLFPDISELDSEITLTGFDNNNDLDNGYFYDWLKNYSKQQSLSVIVRGWEERFAGMMVKDLYWKSFDAEDLGGNQNMIGPYLIKSVTHNFGTKQGYTQRLVLLKNAYYKSEASLIPIKHTNTATTGILS
jgi:hypothetical protein